MRPVPLSASRRCGVFTTREAIDAGWTSHALRHAIEHGYLERLRLGVYALPLNPSNDPFLDTVQRLRRASAAFSVTNVGVPVSHTSAGAVLGLDLVDPPVDRVCATFARGRRGAMAGVHRHRGRLQPSDVGRCNGVLLTSPARTVLDIGHEHGADACIAAANSAIRSGRTTRAALDALVCASELWPGIRPAHRAIALADGKSESALESISTLRIADADLPAPHPQAWLCAGNGHLIGRTDFYWDEPGVVGEADGTGKYVDDPHALIAEKRRQGRLEDQGLIVVRWGWRDLHNFGPVAAELQAAFARGMRPDRALRRWRVGPGPQISAAS